MRRGVKFWVWLVFLFGGLLAMKWNSSKFYKTLVNKIGNMILLLVLSLPFVWSDTNVAVPFTFTSNPFRLDSLCTSQPYCIEADEKRFFVFVSMGRKRIDRDWRNESMHGVSTCSYQEKKLDLILMGCDFSASFAIFSAAIKCKSLVTFG